MNKHKLNVEDRLILLDPHHDDIKYVCVDGQFYNKMDGHTCWSIVKRPHITPERIEMYAKLLDDDKMKQFDADRWWNDYVMTVGRE